MTQSQNFTEEELRDELLTVTEDSQQVILNLAEKIEKIENEGKMLLDMKVIAIKNRMVEDMTIPDDALEQAVLDEIQKVAKEITEDVEKKIRELVD